MKASLLTARLMAAILLAAGLNACASGAVRTLPPSVDMSSADEAEILNAVDRFFAAQQRRDIAEVEALIIPEGVLFSREYGADATRFRTMRNEAWLERFRAQDSAIEERTSNSFVLARGPVATVWQSFTYSLNGAFAYCGVNVITLIQIDDAWKIAGLTWTVEHASCPP